MFCEPQRLILAKDAFFALIESPPPASAGGESPPPASAGGESPRGDGDGGKSPRGDADGGESPGGRPPDGDEMALVLVASGIPPSPAQPLLATQLAEAVGQRETWEVDGSIHLVWNKQRGTEWSVWCALQVPRITRPSTGESFERLDAHITLFYANADCEQFWDEMLQAMATELAAIRRQVPLTMAMVYDGDLDPEFVHYAWSDILVASRMHEKLHKLCSAAFVVARRRIARWKWAFGSKRAFHLSFRTGYTQRPAVDL